jgi:hypothetical protein
VAAFSTGINFTFNGITATEVIGLSWTWGGGLPKGRSIVWTDDAGSVTIESLGGANTGLYGTRGTLTIAGGGMGLTATACCTSVSAAAELNGVTRYTTEFKIIQ